MSAPAAAPAADRLATLGAFGFAKHETIILAALVTEDPLLLIGPSGTGKTFLLNSISEALGLEHRHYNASLLAFDDLVGFPYPDDARENVRFLQTPATVWGAESVLIDEISRCRPEHQNRLFALVHERRLQGLALTKLRYRWAAMNPCGADQAAGTDDETYTGSVPLDPALADRFALLVPVGDWDSLADDDRRRVADPSGEDRVADDGGVLREQLAAWQASFRRELPRCPASIVAYTTQVLNALRGGGVRLSPRRSRLLARSLLAATIVHGQRDERVFRQVLGCSLPQPAWGAQVPAEKVDAAHQLAWAATGLSGKEKWLHEFHLEPSLARKAELLVGKCPDPDTGTIAVEQLLANESPARAAAFALAAGPAAVQGCLPVGAEAVNDLAKLAQQVLAVDAEVSWTVPPGTPGAARNATVHPELDRYGRVVEDLSGGRQARARQLFNYLVVKGLVVRDAQAFEVEFHRCVLAFGWREEGGSSGRVPEVLRRLVKAVAGEAS